MAIQSAERVSQTDASDNYVFQRSMLAYCKAAEIVSGNVLEIGTGSGYGISIIAPHTESFLTIDKTPPPAGVIPEDSNVTFRCMKVPPLKEINSGCMDYVVTFQVIEHIKDDFATIAEIKRVLKPGGKLIISTPNKSMSLTRNPWHVREYTVDEFKGLISFYFDDLEALGIYGNGKVMQYYENNKRSVEAVLKYDVLKLEKNLPRWCLKIPYDVANRLNRVKLLKDNGELTASICAADYYLKKANEDCLDLFFIAKKEA